MTARISQADLRALPLADACLDGIWYCASLLRIPDEQTPVVLGELGRVLRPGGTLAPGHRARRRAPAGASGVRPGTDRWFFYRDANRLRGQLAAAGLPVLAADEQRSSRQ